MQLLYSTVLVSVKHQRHSTIGTPMSPDESPNLISQMKLLGTHSPLFFSHTGMVISTRYINPIQCFLREASRGNIAVTNSTATWLAFFLLFPSNDVTGFSFQECHSSAYSSMDEYLHGLSLISLFG